MAEQPRYRNVRDAITNGVESLEKWYRKVDGSSDAYFICLVLDPNVKDLYCRSRWSADQYDAGMERLKELFDQYYTPPTSPTTSASTHMVSESEVTASTSASIRYGGSYLLEAVQSFCQEEKAAGSPRDELKLYLESGPEPTNDVIGWWGRQTESRYPTMRRIARDYLAIQGSSTPSERAFSSGGITGTARRNSLSADIFEALQILKSAYRNQHVAAVYQAAEHVDALISALDEVDHSSEGEE